MAFTVPQPRTPLNGSLAQWYESGLGWAVSAGPPVQLLTGLRFDVLELPAAAGFALLRRYGRSGPVALVGRRMRWLVAAGSADELPGLLDWLEWGGVALDLRAIGAGGRMTAPVPPGWTGSPGAAVWLRPPEPGCEVEARLPSFTGLTQCGGDGEKGASGASRTARDGRAAGLSLVRLVAAAATECHRARLFHAQSPGGAGNAETQPFCFS
ncbi:SCO3374 family protein [Streptomyces sp. ASQP_92]|uniref:SCO3374 family protein n=1 Tax=Streptomyces sp. ASQP_92 TaxID=2979116 RepID=UPI0021BFC884|nr:SCO3374 family protein [Streptomyces sp. ASQP_92]MCT9091345.1 SCO3374 family protein [Streptomyces sp. ASQP_92]